MTVETQGKAEHTVAFWLSQRWREASHWSHATTRVPYSVSMTLLLFYNLLSSLQCSIRQNVYLPIYSECSMEVINMPLAKRV